MWEAISANQRRSALLIASLAALLAIMGMAIGFLMGGRPQTAYFGAFVGICIWGVLLLVNLMGGESVLLSSANAREVGHDEAPQLYNVVEEMRIAAALPAMPRTFIIDTPVPNAFAVGLNPERACVAVTAGLLDAMRWLADSVPLYAVNVLLSTATEMWALRYPETHTLYVLDRRHDNADRDFHLRTNRIRAYSRHLCARSSVVFASERMDDDPRWRLMEPGELIHVDAGLRINRSTALPGPPRHRLAKSDLDGPAQ